MSERSLGHLILSLSSGGLLILTLLHLIGALSMESLFNGIILANVLPVYSQIQSALHKPIFE